MASSEWQEIYRSYSTEELDKEIRDLKADLEGNYSSQQSGGTGHTRDTAGLRDRLQAATRVREQRSGRGYPRRGRVDFSGIEFGDL